MPECLLSLRQLDVLDLSSNRITSVPASAAALRCSELNLNDNQVRVMAAAPPPAAASLGGGSVAHGRGRRLNCPAVGGRN